MYVDCRCIDDCGTWLRIPFNLRVVGLNPALAATYVGTLDKSLTRSCLRHFGVKLQHRICAVSGAPPSSSGLEEAL